MKNFQFITINELYAKVVEDLSLSPSHKNRVINWIGEGSEFIQTNSVLVVYSEQLEVKNYMTEVPCNTITLLGTFINGYRINYASDIINNTKRSVKNVRLINTTEVFVNEDSDLTEVYPNKSVLKYNSLISTNDVHKSLTYNKRGRHLHFNFQEGIVDIFYKGLLMNGYGEIMYPDEINYKECIVHWVHYKAIIAGILKGNTSDAYQLHKNFKIKAINNIEFPSPEQMQSILENQSLFTVTNEYEIIV